MQDSQASFRELLGQPENLAVKKSMGPGISKPGSFTLRTGFGGERGSDGGHQNPTGLFLGGVVPSLSYAVARRARCSNGAVSCASTSQYTSKYPL
jgi:hypothetical protein